jgi:hypothetical protein
MFVASSPLVVGTDLTLVFHRPVGIALLAITAVVEAGVAFGAYEIVSAIGKDHREAATRP